RNLLLTQLFLDFQRVRRWYPPAEFVKRILAGADTAVIQEYTREMESLLATPHLFDMNEETLALCIQWDDFCERLFHAYQELALVEAEAAG
ncbi:MAG: acyl-CoA dehydrogenase, partial [Desulfosudaceae bacterium]